MKKVFIGVDVLKEKRNALTSTKLILDFPLGTSKHFWHGFGSCEE
jgi:hypothetical protein